jgi:hypothetical protein
MTQELSRGVFKSEGGQFALNLDKRVGKAGGYFPDFRSGSSASLSSSSRPKTEFAG